MSKGYRIKQREKICGFEPSKQCLQFKLRVAGSEKVLVQVRQASSFWMLGNCITAGAKDQNVSR